MNEKILFNVQECEKIIDYRHMFDIAKHFGLNNRIDRETKKYNFYLIEKNENTDWLFRRLINWFSESTEIEILYDTIERGLLHNYKIGDAFPKHIDRSFEFKDRLYNVGIQLNSEYAGGDYIIYGDYNKQLSKEPGNTYFYDSAIFHEVTKITDGERWSFLIHISKNNIKDFKSNKII